MSARIDFNSHAPQGTNTCIRRDKHGTPCGAPATIHALVTATTRGQGQTLMSCREHWPEIISATYDYHPMSPACGMPGSVWDAADTHSFCHWPEGEAIAAEHHYTNDVPA